MAVSSFTSQKPTVLSTDQRTPLEGPAVGPHPPPLTGGLLKSDSWFAVSGCPVTPPILTYGRSEPEAQHS